MLRVQPAAAYLVYRDGVQWRGVDYDARFYTLMVKGSRSKLKAGSYATLPTGKPFVYERFDNKEEDVPRIRRRFGNWAAQVLKAQKFSAVSLFPVPNSDVTPAHAGGYGTQEIADAIARAFGPNAEVITGLRFRQAMTPAHSGGTRDRAQLAAAMRYSSSTKPKGVPVLVDDLLTGGGHLLAARDVLNPRGINCEYAIVCGRRTEDQVADPFNLPEEDIDPASKFAVFEDFAAFEE